MGSQGGSPKRIFAYAQYNVFESACPRAVAETPMQRMGVTHAKCHEVVFPDAATVGGERASAANSITLGRLLLVPVASFQVRLHACACVCL